MRKTIATSIGFAGCGFFTYELLQLVKTGTCSSGGPDVLARQCPSGTGGEVVLLTLSVVLVLIAMIAGGGLLLWCGLFLSSGVGMLVHALVVTNPPAGAQTAGYTVGTIFIAMGGIPLVYLLGSRFSRLQDGTWRRTQADRSITAASQQMQRAGDVQASVRPTPGSPAVPAATAVRIVPAASRAAARGTPLQRI